MEADKLTALAAALEYVEQNLTSEFSQEKCARYACCSLSGLQKLFRSVFRRSVGDYVARRRLTAAARELQQTDRHRAGHRGGIRLGKRGGFHQGVFPGVGRNSVGVPQELALFRSLSAPGFPPALYA